MNADIVVIGGGVNGLVAAQLLARAGRRVLLLTRRPEGQPRGPDAGWVPPGVVRDLALGGRGLQVHHPDPWMTVPLPDGGRLDFWQDVGRTAGAIRRLSPADADRWPLFCHRMRRLAGLLEAVYQRPAPDPTARATGDLFRLVGLGLRARRLGREGLADLLQVPPMSVATLLDEWFETDALRGVLAAGAVAHLCQGPRGAGTAFTFLHHHAGSPAGVFRPPRSNLGAVLAALPGVTRRHGATVERILVREGRVGGVVLAGGEEIGAPVVVSSADPRSTLLDLLEPGWLDPEFVRAVRNIKYRGVAARVELRLDRPAGFAALAIAPGLDYVERAYDEAKYGRVSAHPWIEAVAENGRVLAHVQYAPHTLADASWDEARRRALGDTTVRLLDAAVPGLAGVVRKSEVLTPHDLALRHGLAEGQVHHGELTLDQVLFMRPVPGWSRYGTPIAGLYLCGAGTHPGGGVLGGAGRLAARHILKEMRK